MTVSIRHCFTIRLVRFCKNRKNWDESSEWRETGLPSLSVVVPPEIINPVWTSKNGYCTGYDSRHREGEREGRGRSLSNDYRQRILTDEFETKNLSTGREPLLLTLGRKLNRLSVFATFWHGLCYFIAVAEMFAFFLYKIRYLQFQVVMHGVLITYLDDIREFNTNVINMYKIKDINKKTTKLLVLHIHICTYIKYLSAADDFIL